MKLFAIALFALVGALYAQEPKKEGPESFVFTETYRSFRDEKRSDDQMYVVWAQRSFAKRFGGFGWAQTSQTWRQAYAGGYVKPFSWLQVGAGGGVESTGTAARLGTFAYAAKGKFYTFAIYENSTKSGSGYWYFAITDYKVSDRFSIGSHNQAYIGHGVRTEFRFAKLGNWTASIRPAVLWNDLRGVGPDAAIIGLRMAYFRGN